SRPSLRAKRSNLVIVFYEIATATSWPRNDELAMTNSVGIATAALRQPRNGVMGNGGLTMTFLYPQ
ncbi:MAG: hypothetical protein ACP5TY_11745, partial [Thermodesulforhabdaceae bacterium]